jgi:hypothetical protein
VNPSDSPKNKKLLLYQTSKSLTVQKSTISTAQIFLHSPQQNQEVKQQRPNANSSSDTQNVFLG